MKRKQPKEDAGEKAKVIEETTAKVNVAGGESVDNKMNNNKTEATISDQGEIENASPSSNFKKPSNKNVSHNRYMSREY